MSIVRIPLTQGAEAIIDDADYPLVRPHSWHLQARPNKRYAATAWNEGGRKVHVAMHRLLLDPPPGAVVVHLNGDGLDNRRANLRLSASSGAVGAPVWGASRFRGVSWHQTRRAWRSELQVDGKRLFLGCFASEEEAAYAYDRAASQHLGDRAALNFP
jgi:hypothetical protein